MAQSRQISLTNPKIIVSRAITEADANTTVIAVEVPAKHFIPPKGVTVCVVEVFAGGTPSLDVGDADDDDGWVDSTEVTETTVGSYSGLAAGTAHMSDTGKYYPTGGQIKVVVATGATGGTAYVIVTMYDFTDVDLAAA
jgi:hypothetical protein